MKKGLKKTAMALTMSAVLLMGSPVAVKANTFTGTNPMFQSQQMYMNQQTQQPMYYATNTNNNAATSNFNNVGNKQQQQESVFTGVLEEISGEFFIEINDKKYPIFANKNDINTALPILANDDIAISITGQYDKNTNTIYFYNLNIIDEIDEDISDLIQDAIEISEGIVGELIEEEGVYYIVDSDDDKYEIEASRNDIASIIPALVNKEVEIKVRGVYNTDDEILDVNHLHINSELEEETEELVQKAIYFSENAQGTILKEEGVYKLKVSLVKYNSEGIRTRYFEKVEVISNNDNIDAVLPVISDEDIYVKVKGFYDLEEESVLLDHLHISSQLSDDKREDINEAIEAANERTGYILKEDDDLFFKVGEDKYKMQVSGQEFLTLSLILANKDIEVTIIGDLDREENILSVSEMKNKEELPEEIQEKVMRAFYPIPLLEEERANMGVLVEENNRFFIERDGERKGEITPVNENIEKVLPIIADKDVKIAVKGLVDEDGVLEVDHLDIQSKLNYSTRQDLQQALYGNQNNTGFSNGYQQNQQNNNQGYNQNNPYSFANFYSNNNNQQNQQGQNGGQTGGQQGQSTSGSSFEDLMNRLNSFIPQNSGNSNGGTTSNGGGFSQMNFDNFFSNGSSNFGSFSDWGSNFGNFSNMNSNFGSFSNNQQGNNNSNGQ